MQNHEPKTSKPTSPAPTALIELARLLARQAAKEVVAATQTEQQIQEQDT